MPEGREVVVVGAGGHAKVVIATLQAAGCRVKAAYDDRAESLGTSVLGVPVVGCVADADRSRLPAVLAIGDNRGRSAAASSLALEWIPVIHPRAWVHATVSVGPGSVVFAGAIVQPDTRISAHVIVNTGASIDHDCDIGDFAHIGPGSHLAGGVHVAEGAFLGIGTQAIPCVRIGRWARTGAGAVCVSDVAAGALAIGVPARVRAEAT